MDRDAVFASLGLDAAALRRGTLSVVSPIDGTELARVREHASEDVDAAIERAVAAFAVWRSTPGPRRGELVRLFGEELRASKEPLGRLVTFHFVCFGWVFFNADSFATALDLLGRLITGWTIGPELVTPLVVLAIAAVLVAQLIPPLLARQASAALSTVPVPALAVGFAVWIMVVVAFGPEGVSEFIYFQF